MVARINTVAFAGIDPLPVDVQVQMASGLPAFQIVGLPDKAVAESRERVRAALYAMGISLPPKRIIVIYLLLTLPRKAAITIFLLHWAFWSALMFCHGKRYRTLSHWVSWRWMERFPMCQVFYPRLFRRLPVIWD